MRAYLKPIAAPAILGLYGFAVATFMVSANIAGWYGTSDTLEYLAPFAATVGGLAQFLAGMWSFKARDPLASSPLSMRGAYWIAFGILYALGAAGTLTIPTGAFPAFGFWFIGLGAVTAVGAVAATTENMGLVTIPGTVAVGCGCFAVGLISGTSFWEVIAANLFIIGALAAFYTASAMLFEGTFGRVVLPLGKTRQTKEKAGLSAGIGEPGVKHGQ